MATITSASSYADIKNAYLDNLSYATDGSVTKARAFVEACRALMIVLAESQGKAGEELRMGLNLVQIRKELDAAQAYVSANSSGNSTTHKSFESFR